MFVYSTALPVHEPFELVMEKSGVKTRSPEQTMLPAEADILLVTDSSSEEDSEADDQSYYPPEVYVKEICPRGNNKFIIYFLIS